MTLVNENFLSLREKFFFDELAKKVNACKLSHPTKRIINLAGGDVSQPLCPAVVEAMHKAVDEMGRGETFRGYGPGQGYRFLRDAIVKYDYLPRGIHIDPSEVFVSDGAKSDTGNIQELISRDNFIGVMDPVSPVYIDANAMMGRTGKCCDGRWTNVCYLACNKANGYSPQLPQQPVDIIYLCCPNNPMGTVLTKDQLKMWVSYAQKNDALIFFDAAYEAYIQNPDIPHSIYEIKGARHVAIEFRSFSKTAGFTGIRCGYTVIPKALQAVSMDGERVALNTLWQRRQSTKYSGASYISQRAAEATYSDAGRLQVRATIQYYMDNAAMMREMLLSAGWDVTGGENAPYLWVRIPYSMDSWQFFNHLLYASGVVCAPGVGFGPSGEGYVRLTALADRNDCVDGVRRMVMLSGITK